jgi:hypothetical protein
MIRRLPGRRFFFNTSMHMYAHSSYPSLLLQETGQMILRLTKSQYISHCQTTTAIFNTFSRKLQLCSQWCFWYLTVQACAVKYHRDWFDEIVTNSFLKQRCSNNCGFHQCVSYVVVLCKKCKQYICVSKIYLTNCKCKCEHSNWVGDLVQNGQVHKNWETQLRSACKFPILKRENTTYWASYWILISVSCLRQHTESSWGGHQPTAHSIIVLFCTLISCIMKHM